MKEPIIKRKHKSKNIFKEEVRKIPVKDRPNIKLSTIKGNGPNGQLTARQIDHSMGNPEVSTKKNPSVRREHRVYAYRV